MKKINRFLNIIALMIGLKCSYNEAKKWYDMFKPLN